MTDIPLARQFLRSTAIQPALCGMREAIASTGGVMLVGEPSTGREVVARAIHVASTRGYEGPMDRLIRQCSSTPDNEGPRFIAADCRSTTDTEAAVFGRCDDRKPAEPDGLARVAPGSLLHRALGGTLFIRGLQEMPIRLQIRLAKMLRDGEAWISTKDGEVLTPIGVRVMAALDSSGSVSPDEQVAPSLYRRLAIHRIVLPPLRERREDIPALVRMLLASACRSSAIPLKAPSTQAMALLAALPWRGNLQELRDFTRRLVLNVPGRTIRVNDVLAHVKLDAAEPAFVGVGTLREARKHFEREYVATVLERHHGRMAEAARALGIERANLYRKVRELSLDRRGRGRS